MYMYEHTRCINFYMRYFNMHSCKDARPVQMLQAKLETILATHQSKETRKATVAWNALHVQHCFFFAHHYPIMADLMRQRFK